MATLELWSKRDTEDTTEKFPHLIVTSFGLQYSPRLVSTFNVGARVLSVNRAKNPVMFTVAGSLLISAEKELRKTIERCHAKNSDVFSCWMVMGSFSLPFNVVDYDLGKVGDEYRDNVQLMVFVYPPQGTKLIDLMKGIAANVDRPEESHAKRAAL